MPKRKAIRPVGRPTKYYPEIINKIDEYFTTVGREQTELPTIEGLADYLAITTETVYQWGKKYTEFSDTIKKVAAKQKIQLMNDGMYGGKEVNAAMAIFLLKVNHGMNEGPNTLIQVNVKPILGGKSVSTNVSNKEDTQTKQEN